MSQMKKILVKPEIKNAFLKNGRSEKVTYLEIPKDFYNYSLESDIEKGGKHYKEIQEIVKKPRLSRVIAITSDSLEMGLMAITYLSMHLQDVRLREGDIPFDTELDESAHFWYESSVRIPMITVTEMTRYLRKDEFAHEQGGFLVGTAKMKEHHEPYWRKCSMEAVCIIANRTSLVEDSMDAIQLFARNRQVYVIFLENSEREADMDELPFGIMDRRQFLAFRNNFILSYAADEITVSLEDKFYASYYKNILKQNLKQRGIKVKRGFSYERVVNLAGSINKKNLCEMIDKTINYALKDFNLDEEIVLGNENFKFIDHFMREKSMDSQGRNGSQLLEENLVGMKEIKEQVRDVVNVMKYHQIRRNMNIPGSHYHNVHVMLGAPGTAKTTVAKYMGQMMFDEKLLPDTRFVCVNGAELKGMYVGHSAPKTKALFEKYDVIIIDEAYSIVENGGATDSFGTEAIAQLIIELEKHSTDKLVIFAGYGGEDVEEKDNRMKDFLEANPGIKSRITSTFYFRSYSPEEMAEIFIRIARNGNYVVEAGAEQLVKEYFADRVAERDFGNGREARVLLENTTLFAARRLMSGGKKNFTDSDMKLLKIEDIQKALEKMGAGVSITKYRKNNRIGFGF